MSAYDTLFLSHGPAVYLKCDESSGSFTDSSGNSLTGTKSGTVTYSQASLLPADSATSVLLDGSTGRISVADNALLRFADSMTLCGWIKPTSAKAPTHLFAKGFDYGIDLPGVGVVRMTTKVNTPSENYTVVNNNGLFVAHTHDKATGLQRLFVNGVVKATHQFLDSNGQPVATGVGAAGTNVLEIGSFAGGETLPAYVQKLGAVGSALTVAEIQALFVAGVKTADETDGRQLQVMPFARSVTVGENDIVKFSNGSDTPFWMSRGGTAARGTSDLLNPRQKVTVRGSEFAGDYSFMHEGYLGIKLLGVDRWAA